MTIYQVVQGYGWQRVGDLLRSGKPGPASATGDCRNDIQFASVLREFLRIDLSCEFCWKPPEHHGLFSAFRWAHISCRLFSARALRFNQVSWVHLRSSLWLFYRAARSYTAHNLLACTSTCMQCIRVHIPDVGRHGLDSQSWKSLLQLFIRASVRIIFIIICRIIRNPAFPRVISWSDIGYCSTILFSSFQDEFKGRTHFSWCIHPLGDPSELKSKRCPRRRLSRAWWNGEFRRWILFQGVTFTMRMRWVCFHCDTIFYVWAW